MKITEINIHCFGRLRHFVLRPTDGVNLVYGENESGKTTVMAFLKAMLYGMDSETRRRYEPWDGGQPGGTLELMLDDGKTFLLSRTFGAVKNEDRISLFNRTLAESVILPAGQEPGVLLLGMNVKSFVNTLYIGQSGVAVAGENSEITARLVNLASAGDERISKGEVEKRLTTAASILDSKKAAAILPELRKQRHELLESRAEMQKSLAAADEMRDALALAYSRRNSLTKERDFLRNASGRLEMQAELDNIDSVIAAREKLTSLEAQCAELDAAFSGERGEKMAAFLADADSLMEEQQSKRVQLEEKQKAFDEWKKQAETIDRGKLSLTRVVNKYPKEIAGAFERYDALMNEKQEAEQALANAEADKSRMSDTLLILVVCAVVILSSVVLGAVAHWIFYVVGIIAVVSIVAYLTVYKKGFKVDGLGDERTELQGIEEELRQLNLDMQPIFELFAVNNMEQFDREYKEIEAQLKQYTAYRTQKQKLRKEVESLMDDMDEIQAALRERLSEYHQVDSNEEALTIISRLFDMKQRHDALHTQRDEAQEHYRTLLGERDFDELVERGKSLRGDITLDVPDNFTSERINGRLRATEEKLNELTQEIIRRETELSLRPYNEQDVGGITDELKALGKRMEHYEFELAALNEAQNALNEAFEEMKLDFGPLINYRAKRILSGMIGEEYSALFVTNKLIPSVTPAGTDEPRGCDVLSAGTADQVYLALRLALSGLMADESLPVVMDDSLVQFDDARMEKALGFIRDDRARGELGQVILFTCHKRVLLAAKRLDMIDGVFHMAQSE